jgi:hypothetical protein
MFRSLLLVMCCAAACGRGKGVPDDKLGNLVIAPKSGGDAIDVDLAAKDPAELGRALGAPVTMVQAALGPATITIDTRNTVTENGVTVSGLTDKVTLELGERGAFHGVYANSADYGRETLFVGGKLYLRPRYQVWHERAPETPDEPAALREQYYDAIAATWELLAFAAELSDRGPVLVAGRTGRKVEVKLAPGDHTPPAEHQSQRRWREGRTVEELAGEVVLDPDKGVPLTVKLAGTVAFMRDGRRFSMKLAVESAVDKIGKPAALAAPAPGDVVATPERAREVDDRDFLLRGIAPPLRQGDKDKTEAKP